MCVCEWEYLCGGDFRVSFVFVFLAAQLGRCSCMAATYRATSQKQPYKCYCAHLIDLSQAQGRPDRLTIGEEWQGMVGEQTSEPVSAAEEVGPQVARRHAWVGALAFVRCQQ